MDGQKPDGCHVREPHLRGDVGHERVQIGEQILHPLPALSLRDDVRLGVAAVVSSSHGALTLGEAISSGGGGSCFPRCWVLTFGFVGVGLAAAGQTMLPTLDGIREDDVLPFAGIHAHRAANPGSTVVVLSGTQEGHGRRRREAAFVGGGGGALVVVMGTVLSHDKARRILDFWTRRGGEM